MRSGLALLFILLSACAPRGQSNPTRSAHRSTVEANAPAPAPKPESAQVNLNWSPENITIECASGECPLQIGALIFAKPAAGGKINLTRCTAFLVDSQTIMSNAHCDGTAQGPGWFLTQKINGKKEIREISAVTYKRFTPHPKGERFTSGRPDAALFSLRSALNMPALRLAQGAQKPFNKLISYAILRTDGDKLILDKAECEVRRHEAEFPFEIQEAPDVIKAFGCHLPPGSSGSPMFAPGSNEVQALHIGGMTPQVRAELAKRPLQVFERQFTNTAANIRCLDMPGAKPITCAAVTDEASAARFRDVQNLEQDKLAARKLGDAGMRVGLKSVPFVLKPVQEMRFEVIHLPECRKGSAPLTKADFIVEQVRIQFDEWAQPKTESLSQVLVPADLVLARNNIYSVRINWPAPAAEYLEPELDLRKAWGSSFHIDIPPCAR